MCEYFLFDVVVKMTSQAFHTIQIDILDWKALHMPRRTNRQPAIIRYAIFFSFYVNFFGEVEGGGFKKNSLVLQLSVLLSKNFWYWNSNIVALLDDHRSIIKII